MANYTFTDLMKLPQNTDISEMVMDCITDVPLINALRVMPCPDEKICKYTRVNELPQGEFRASGVGKTAYTADIERVSTNLAFYDMSYFLDSRDVSAAPTDIASACEEFCKWHVAGGLKALEAACIYGDAATIGFSGLAKLCPAANVVDVGGTEEGKCTKVFAIRLAGLGLGIGLDGTINVGELINAPVTDADGKVFFGYGQSISMFGALCDLAPKTSIAMAKNIDTVKTFNDNVISALVGKLNGKADMILVSNRSSQQLTDSRALNFEASNGTVTTVAKPALYWGNIPVVTLSTIVDTNNAA